ncbi:MAG: MlaD family protein [Gammaproteobacteria bacterium]
MEPKVNYVLVGAFVVVLALAFAAGVIWLGKSDYRNLYDRYYAYMRESVSGLSVDAAVDYRGVEVGRVKEIMLNPANTEEVRLLLEIERGTPVKQDTVAVLETQGLTGLATINLTGGTRGSPDLVPRTGEEYAVIRTGPSLFARVDQGLSKLLAGEYVTNALASIDAMASDVSALASAENRARLERILADLATVTHTLAARRDRLDRGIDDLAAAAADLAGTAAALQARLPGVLDHADAGAVALQQAAVKLDRTAGAAEGMLGGVRPDVELFAQETLPQAAALVGELRRLTATLNRLAEELDRHPQAAVFGRPPPPRGPGE